MNDNMFKNAFDAIDDEFLADAKNPTIRIVARRKKIIVSSIAACVAAVLVAIPSIKVLSDVDKNKITTKPEVEYEIEYEYEEQIIHRPSTSSKSSKPQTSSLSSKPQKDESSTPKNSEVSSDEEILTSSQKETSSKNISSKKTSSKKQTGTKGPSTTSSKKPIISKGPSSTSSKKETGHTSAISSSSNVSSTSSTPSTPPGIDLGSDITINLKDIIVELSSSWLEKIETFQEVYVPSVEYLYINPIPSETHTTIHKYLPTKRWSKTEICNYVDKYMPKIADAFGITLSSYEVKKLKYTDEYYVSTDGIHISDDQNVSISKTSITLYGESVAIDSTKSDSEILEGLSSVQEKLGILFDTTFEISTIHRVYVRTGGPSVIVDFYPKDYSSHLRIYFHTGSTFLSYYVNNPNNPTNSISKQVELLSLEKAEEYLNKGYVLMENCPPCQIKRPHVDVSDYDYVSFSSFTVKNTEIPCYKFYKYFKTASNGNLVYLCLYVPAIEIEGYEEYFENIHNNHN